MKGNPVSSGRPVKKYADVVEYLRVFHHVGFFLGGKYGSRIRKETE
jgi:hypothetical protein